MRKVTGGWLSRKQKMQLDRLLIFCDGGARGNPGPAASASVIYDISGKVREKCGKYLGVSTNNSAEYEAVILAWETIRNKKLAERDTKIIFHLDSSLLVNQLNGLFKVKDSNLRDLVVKIRSFESDFSDVVYKYIPREKNTEADRVVNEILNKRME